MLRGWAWWRGIGSPTHIAAPMVDQSERAFRLLVRELGVELCFTPMLSARQLVHEPGYSRLLDAGRNEDMLIAQIAGYDPATMLSAARLCEAAGACAVDLNLGCPQEIARRGRYGAFLLEDEPSLALQCVEAVASGLRVPTTAKLRLATGGREATIETCARLEAAGVSALCLHGRTRLMTNQQGGCGAADWKTIRAVVDAVGVPVISNGGVASRTEAEAALAATGAAAVMSAEALLENPALFCASLHPESGEHLTQDALAARYLELCRDHPPAKGVAVVKAHLRKMLHGGLERWPNLADELQVANSLEAVSVVAGRLAEAGWQAPDFRSGTARVVENSWWRGGRFDAFGDLHTRPMPASPRQVHSPLHSPPREGCRRRPARGRAQGRARGRAGARARALAARLPGEGFGQAAWHRAQTTAEGHPPRCAGGSF